MNYDEYQSHLDGLITLNVLERTDKGLIRYTKKFRDRRECLMNEKMLKIFLNIIPDNVTEEKEVVKEWFTFISLTALMEFCDGIMNVEDIDSYIHYIRCIDHIIIEGK